MASIDKRFSCFWEADSLYVELSPKPMCVPEARTAPSACTHQLYYCLLQLGDPEPEEFPKHSVFEICRMDHGLRLWHLVFIESIAAIRFFHLVMSCKILSLLVNKNAIDNNRVS